MATFIERSRLAYHETGKWAKAVLGISFMASIIGHASTQHLGKSHMAWTEILIDLGIFGGR